MTRDEKLANVTAHIKKLSDDQVDAVIAFVEYAASGRSVYETASPEIRAGIERGLSDIEAGRVHTLDEVTANMSAKIAALKE